MILRTGERVFEIQDRNVTHETFKRACELASLEAQLTNLKALIVKESANGSSRELRRLREKAGRLEKRIANNETVAVARSDCRANK